MDDKKVYGRLYSLVRAALTPLMKYKYDFETDYVPEMSEPFLFLSNHTTEDDAFFSAIATRQPMYFVCADHLLRNKVYGKIFQYIINPIPVPKGGSTLTAVRKMLKRLRAGDNVYMCYEGKRSYHGETMPPSAALGALVKKAGCALVTYRVVGGYFTYPRWARGNTRRGHVEGKVVGVYSSAELAKMSADEITEIIRRDTYENAYETQREKMWEYKGHDLAKGMDLVAFICPNCGREDTIKTDGNNFYCTECSLFGEYDNYGFLHGTDLKFDNLHSWMRWIETEFDKRIKAHDDSPVYVADAIELYTMDENYKNHTVTVDRLTVYKDKFVIGGYEFSLSDVPFLSVLYGNVVLFTYNDIYYGLTAEDFKAWKCARLWHLIKGDTDDRTKEI